MTAAARRFRLEIAGQVMVGLAFASEGELEAWLAARGAVLVDALASGLPAPPRARRPRRELSPAEDSKGPGRVPIDDADALSEIAALVAQGLKPAAAVRTVAKTLGEDMDTAAHRLRRKRRKLPGQNAGRN